MRPDHSRVEHLDQVGRGTQLRQRLEEGLNGAALAQSPEPLPDRVPVPKLGWQRPPGHVLQREIVQRFEKLAVVTSFGTPSRANRPKNVQSDRPILFRHPRQHGRSSQKPTRYESPTPRLVNVAIFNPSTRPRPMTPVEEITCRYFDAATSSPTRLTPFAMMAV